MTLILSNREIDSILTMPDCIDALEDAYVELSEGRAVSRRRSDCIVPTSRPGTLHALKTMDGVAPKLGVGAVRINSDILTWPVVDGMLRRVKIPAAPDERYVGLVLLFSTETGEPLAIFPDGVVQRMRVGAANGLAAKYLARGDSSVVGLIGSGWQAGAQLMAITAVRPIEAIRCFSPNPEHRARFADEMTKRLGLDVQAVDSAERAVADVDVAMCGTSSIQPIFFADWVRPGMHLSSIKRPEMDAAAIRKADRFIIHSRDAAPIHVATRDLDHPERQEGKGAALLNEFDFDTLPVLPDLAAGKVEGRRNDDEVTCFINNIGMGYQFAVIGALALERAREKGVGHDLPTDWFTELEHP